MLTPTTTRPPALLAPPPVQTGPAFHCWQCSAPDAGGHYSLALTDPHMPQPLRDYMASVYYMRLACGHNPRTVRLENAIAPLVFVTAYGPADNHTEPLESLDGEDCADLYDRQVDENAARIRAGLALIIAATSPNERHADPAARIVYGLLAGTIAPAAAIRQIHELAH